MAIKKKPTVDPKRRHKFMPFRERVDQIKIDPLRRAKRATDIGDKDTASFFHVALLSWKELNTSQCFVEFCEEVEPISQSLPQVVYHKENIFKIWDKYANERDQFALQPLLDLLVQFTHDLGPDFEVFLPQTITTVTSIATHEDIQVVEWTFNCLAFVFKHLFRFLVAKMSETFDLISPLFSQHERRPHLARFAAESFSFFIRNSKAANIDLFVEHSFKKLQESRSRGFEAAFVTTYAEALKGPEETLHSKARRLIKKLHEFCLRDENDQSFHALLSIITDVMHGTNKDTVIPLYDELLACIQTQISKGDSSPWLISACTKELFLLVGFRKGSRVSDWNAVRRVYEAVEEKLSTAVYDKSFTGLKEFCKLSLAMLRYTGISDPLFRSKIVECVYKLQDKELFILFCDFATDFERNTELLNLLWLYLQRYLDSASELSAYDISVLLMILRRFQAIHRNEEASIPVRARRSTVTNLLRSIDSRLEDLENGGDAYSPLALQEQLDFLYYYGDGNVDIASHMANIIEKVGAEQSTSTSNLAAVYGKSLSILAKSLQTSVNEELSLQAFKAACDRFAYMKSDRYYIQGLTFILRLLPQSVIVDLLPIVTDLVKDIKVNLCSGNAALRLESLRLLSLSAELASADDADKEILKLCISVEETPFQIDTARTLSMHIRRIALDFPTVADAQIALNVISFCVGLLKSNFQPVWQEATATLAKLTSLDKKTVWDLLFAEISKPVDGDLEDTMNMDTNVATEFDDEQEEVTDRQYLFRCTNVQRLEVNFGNALARKTQFQAHILERYAKELNIAAGDQKTIRHRSFGVLATIPKVSEEHSSSLIPMLRQYSQAGQSRFVLLDLLKVFCAFSKSSKSLGDEVFDILLNLLSTPDTEVQKLALAVVYTYGRSNINIYKDNLDNLLSGQVFRDELSNLLLTNDEGAIITYEHASAVFPIIMHLLFGLAVGFSGNNNRAKGSHRSTILSCIANVPTEYIAFFVKLTTSGIPRRLLVTFDGNADMIAPDPGVAEISASEGRRMLGFLNMSLDILQVLKMKLVTGGSELLQGIFSCLIYAQQVVTNEDTSSPDTVTAARAMRNVGLKCLELGFQTLNAVEWSIYRESLINDIILPRMDKFKEENIHEVSPILRIFVAWTESEKLVQLLAIKSIFVSDVITTLDAPSVKETVMLAVMNFVNNLMDLPDKCKDKSIREVVIGLSEHALGLFLPRFVTILSVNRNNEVADFAVSVLQKLVLVPDKYIMQEDSLLEQYILVCLSSITTWGFKHRTGSILDVLATLVSHLSSDILGQKCYDDLCPLLQTTKERHTRASLISVIYALGKLDNDLTVGELLTELNAYAKVRMDDLDFDRRFAAYAKLNEELFRELCPAQWKAVLYDAIFSLAHCDESAVKTAAGTTLKRFIDIVNELAISEAPARADYFALVESILLPGIRAGLRDETEFTRYEYIALLKHMVVHYHAYPRVKDLEILLHDGDEEADFFNNITHIQSHRRQRALLRLGQIATTHSLGDTNIAQFLLPISEHFLRDVTEATSGVAEEAIKTIGKLSLGLSWSQYQAVVRRCVMNIEKNPVKTRFFARLLDSVVQAIYVRSRFYEPEWTLKKYNASKVEKFLTDEIVPKLRGVLRLTEEQTLADRVSVTSPLVKCLAGTSDETLISNLSNVVTELSYHLKNRLQDIRDSVRKAVSRVALLVGPAYLGLILKQMQSVLQRGSQRHILAFCMHSLLVEMSNSPASKHGDFDTSLEIIMDICMNDIFGASGSEKDAEGYISKTREVKEKKSYDSMELVSKNISAAQLAAMLMPIRKILASSSIDLKLERKITDALRRTSNGIADNSEGCSHETIAFCLHICTETPDVLSTIKIQSVKEKRFLLSRKQEVQKNIAGNLHYLQRFALDVIKNCLRKNRDLIEQFELQEFVKSLQPYLMSLHEDIQLSALKLLTTAAKYSTLLKQLNTEVVFKHVVGVIRNAPTVTTEACQTGLKLLATLLQKKKYTAADHSSIAYILQKLYLDLVEPDKQSHSFAFVKAVLQQHIMIPEVYDTMDKLREVMVNSQLKNTRDVCKSLYCQFVMEYPQGKGRLSNQLRFLVHNLEYPHSSGREAVMEVLFVLLSSANRRSKSSTSMPGLITAVVELFFVPLTLTVANDDSAECREMAQLLFRTIANVAEETDLLSMRRSCTEWSGQKGTSELADAAEIVLKSLNQEDNDDEEIDADVEMKKDEREEDGDYDDE
ncbi:uncharacterized protein V1518DRAFT_420109 [Limtongia smithiae]|uniref:uncharacterized protein n=1 Tax=Limtongia smithiae TaxID=1125753 RepID=UPI0034CEFBD8